MLGSVPSVYAYKPEEVGHYCFFTGEEVKPPTQKRMPK